MNGSSEHAASSASHEGVFVPFGAPVEGINNRPHTGPPRAFGFHSAEVAKVQFRQWRSHIRSTFDEWIFGHIGQAIVTRGVSGRGKDDGCYR
jgi:hypothetical protein